MQIQEHGYGSLSKYKMCYLTLMQNAIKIFVMYILGYV